MFSSKKADAKTIASFTTDIADWFILFTARKPSVLQKFIFLADQ